MLWNDGGCEPSVVARRGLEWHSRQSWSTRARTSRFGLEEPCGSWHVVHLVPVGGEPVECSKTNGPRFSAWQFRHGLLAGPRELQAPRPGRPWGSWQDVQSMPAAAGRWANGFSRIDAA